MRYAICTAAKTRTRMFFYIHSGEEEGPRPLGPFRIPCRVGIRLDEFTCEVRACAKVDSSYAVEVGTLRSTGIVENVSYFD
jgi:hypothetical protein